MTAILAAKSLNRPRARRVVLHTAVVVLSLAGAMTAAAVDTVAYTLKLSGSANVPRIEFISESREPITRVTLTIRDGAHHWDGGYTFESPDSPKATLVSPSGSGDRPAALRVDLTDFTYGDRFSVNADIDGNPSYNSVEDYRTVLFNASANAELTVLTADGGTSSMTLTNSPATDGSFVFRSANRPELLTVRSVTSLEEEDTGGVAPENLYVGRVKVQVKLEPSGTLVPAVTTGGVLTTNIGQQVEIPVYIGEEVLITCPETVYKNVDGEDITDDVLSGPDQVAKAVVRFLARGFAVNDVAQTGDKTLYRFTFGGPTTVDVRWTQEFALAVSHDFSRSVSTEKDAAGKPWAGPLDAVTAGSPEPEAKSHWIAKGQNILAEIDGVVADITKQEQGHFVRYVPIGWWAFGPPAEGSTTRAGAGEVVSTNYWFTSFREVGIDRQSVPEFIMDGPAEIQYIWQIQFGVQVGTDLAERNSLPRIFSDGFQVGSGSGMFWFNPDSKVTVVSKANVLEWPSTALNGWQAGDDFYFSNNGKIDSWDGSLIEGGPSLNGLVPVATWVPAYTNASTGIEYRGLEITRIRRSARVQWVYGHQTIRDRVKLGKHVFESDVMAWLGERLSYPPDQIQLESGKVTGSNPNASMEDMSIWDPEAGRLYPLVPGEFKALWTDRLSGYPIDVIVQASYPEPAHYPHIADAPPVALDPDASDHFIFREMRYSENDASVDENKLFRATTPGHTVLLFSELRSVGRGGAKEFYRVRVVETKAWDTNLAPWEYRTIGQKIQDPELDLAELGTGYLLFDKARYNPVIYDALKLDGLASRDVYDLTTMRGLEAQKIVTQPGNLPGPIIPVNLHPRATQKERLVVVWYDDPVMNDELLWPHRARVYYPRWPTSEAQGLGRIVIASQFGSESLSARNQDQVIVDDVTRLAIDDQGAVQTNVFPAATTYDPSRLQQPRIYHQADPTQAGYNPNEEHALMAPSLRFATAAPRPKAAYALRDNDLNRYNAGSASEVGQDATYTSHPYVLTEFFDVAEEEFKMHVYRVVKTASAQHYTFVNQSMVTPGASGVVEATPLTLRDQPNVVMEAGEPVIPFYPLGEVIGASPCPETFGVNIKGQTAYWEDHKGTSWSISGGSNAWFTFQTYYPMAPDFWWPAGEFGYVSEDDAGVKSPAVPLVGDCLAFLPPNISVIRSLPAGTTPAHPLVQLYSAPIKILYKSDWPQVAPILKAGETLTFPGGEHRADNPTTIISDDVGNVTTVETPGLPGVLAFAAGEVIFDSLNPTTHAEYLKTAWTARVGQMLDIRRAVLSTGKYPSNLSPASGRIRVSKGQYVFSELPASLQKRIRYNPLSQSIDPATGLTVSGKLELIGLLNDKAIGDDSLTASPPAVYVLEPNVLTADDLEQLKALDKASDSDWDAAVTELYRLSRNPNQIQNAAGHVINDTYLVGLEQQVVRNSTTQEPVLVPIEPDSEVMISKRDPKTAAPYVAFGPGLALLPNGNFLDPNGTIPGTTRAYPDISWITLVENNDPSLGGLPVTPHIIKVDRRLHYRGSIKTVLSDNVFDENVVLRHTGDFGANAEDLVFEWWYRPDDGSLDVPPPDLHKKLNNQYEPWKLFPDSSGKQGLARQEALLKGDPNAPEALLADTWWFVRYRHKDDVVDGVNWGETRPTGDGDVIYTWAGAGNSDPFNDFDLDMVPDFRAQLAMGWIKRVLDAVNPYEARIRDFEQDAPSTLVSMLSQFGARFEGPVALNPDKNIIENVGLIELYETVLKRGRDLSIDLSRPVSTPAIANALQLAATRIADFYTVLGNEAYTDALDPTIGFGSSSVAYGSLAPAVFTFQNQMASLIEEELGLLHGVDDFYARPVYNRLFWNFTKGEGEAAYAVNYNLGDGNDDGFVNEADAMLEFPQGHGDAWGHYLSAIRQQYKLFKHPYFNWVSRSESYNLMDIVITVDFLDERKFAQMAAARAKAGAEIVNLTYRDKYVDDPMAQWQGYTDSNKDRAWGVQGWARRAGQGAYFDWVTANALLPSTHPNGTLEGVQKVDRKENADIAVVSANLNAIQRTLDGANSGYNPLGVGVDTVPFDINPDLIDRSYSAISTHFEQIYDRAVKALVHANAVWDNANQPRNMLRKIGNSEEAFKNKVFQEDLSYRSRLIKLFGKPYEGTVGPGQIFPAGYNGPDLVTFMYANVREINNDTVPLPTTDFATFDANGTLTAGDLYRAFSQGEGSGGAPRANLADIKNPFMPLYLSESTRRLFAPTFTLDSSGDASVLDLNGLYAVNYTDLVNDPKVPLVNLQQLMPVTAAGYTFQAPNAWGNRPAIGELQVMIAQMIQQEAQIARAVADWDGLQGDIVRSVRMLNAKVDSMANIRLEQEIYSRLKVIADTILAGIDISKEIAKLTKTVTVTTIKEIPKEGVPRTLPTGGFSISPGDALSLVRAGFVTASVATKAAFETGEVILETVKKAKEIAFQIIDNELELFHMRESDALSIKEMYLSLESMVGDEPVKRIAIFKEIEALRLQSNKYLTMVDEGARLIDERTAYNKRVAAQTQRERYQDMTFRVARNYALQSYRSSFDLAARYTFLAARAYEYEVNLDPLDPGAPTAIYGDIVRARGLGYYTSGAPQMGKGGLAESLAWLKANHEVLKNQLGFQNPQTETGKISLRTENYRILPQGETQATAAQFPEPGMSSDALWKQTLQESYVPDLWKIPEFRYYCRPFSSEYDAGGDHVAQPGLVLRFGTQIHAGKNLFGHPLSGADHAYDPTVYATKLRAVGIWFSNYRTGSVTNGLPETPRIYMFPVGQDVMRIANSANPDDVRYWNVVDQAIPVPFTATSAELDDAEYIPLLDSLNGAFGDQRQFSSFRAYHDGSDGVNDGELLFDSRLVGRSAWNTEWMVIIPGLNLDADADAGLDKFMNQVTDIKLVFQTYGYSGN